MTALRDLERFDLTVHGELLERPRLDLADALAGQAELAADRLERRGVAVAVQAVAPLDDLTLALRQLRHGAPQHVLLEADGQLLLGLGVVRRHQLAERGAAVRADRPVETRHCARRLPYLAQLLERQLRLLRDLLLGRLAAQFRRQQALRARDPLLAVDDVDGDPDRPRLVRDASLDCLADPPGRIGRELEAAPPVELLGRA